MNLAQAAPAIGDTAPGADASAQSTKVSFYRPELDCMAVFVHHTMPRTVKFYAAHHLPTALSNVAYAGAFGVDLFFFPSATL
jgi:hypothetical protein